MDTKPLRIEFQLAGHIDVPAMPIHLDSLVAFARFQLAQETQQTGEIRSIIQELPLAKVTRNNAWVWQASALSFENMSSGGLRHWTRKTVIPDYYAMLLADGSIERGRKQTGLMKDAAEKNHDAIHNKDGSRKPYAQKIDTVRGSMKSELQTYPVALTDKAVAYCIGDPSQLEMLLEPEMGYLTHIGKRARLGQGRIVGVTITEDKDAVKLWERRILPWHQEGFLGIDANVKPPYWDAKERVQAWAHPDVF